MSSKTQAAPAAATPPSTREGGTFRDVEIKRIRISPDNRKRFNEQALQELAASIKADGLAQPILIRPVTPTPDAPEEFEIVAGERRYRASGIAGLESIPAVVRELDDLAAAKLRILENLQRENPHEMEEAEGYQLLMMRHGYSADELADEVKKSRSYIYGRLKLCALAPAIREEFLDNKISASTALLIARIPVPDLQLRALKEITEPQGWPNFGEPMSYRKAAQHIQERYTLDLGKAIFPIADARLLASAGSCVKCPKRTGNQAEVYPDVSANVCTDPDCFKEKVAAHHQSLIVHANKNGIPVLDGDEAEDAVPVNWSQDSEYVTSNHHLTGFERNAPATKNKAAAFARQGDGSVVALYRREEMQAALEAAGACETVEAHAERMREIESNPNLQPAKPTWQLNQERQERERKEFEQKAEAINARRLDGYKALREHVRSAGLSLPSLREYAMATLDGLDHDPDVISDLYGFDPRKGNALEQYVEQASATDIQLLLLDVVLTSGLTVNWWQVQHNEIDDGTFPALLKIAGIENIEMQLDEPCALNPETPASAEAQAQPIDATTAAVAENEANIERVAQVDVSPSSTEAAELVAPTEAVDDSSSTEPPMEAKAAGVKKKASAKNAEKKAPQAAPAKVAKPKTKAGNPGDKAAKKSPARVGK